MCHDFRIHSSAKGHLGRFHVLAMANSAAMNIGVHVSLSFLVSSVCMPSSGNAGSYGSSISSFLRNLHTVLHNSCTSLQKVHSNTSLPQETRETSNKQPNFTPEATRKRTEELQS